MDEEIRAPDEPVRECILPQNYSYEFEEDMLKRVLEESQSMFDFEEQERLESFIESIRLEPDIELENAIILSKQLQEEHDTDIELKNAIILSKQLQAEREMRTKHVASFKSRFTQFMRIDTQHKKFYSDIIRYVEKYESGDVTSVSIGEEYYARFRSTLNNMRITPEDKSTLLEILIQ